MVKEDSELAAILKPDEDRPGEFKLLPLGQEKNLVLFFLDVRNFAPFVDSYLPFDVIYMIRKLFEMFHQVITSHQGEIIETAGDGLYAIFGEKNPLNEAAQLGIKAGFQVLVELEKLNQRYGKVFMKEFEIGIGLHCGSVIVGHASYGGNTRKLAMGRAVVIASRLQNSTKILNNSFVISKDVFQHASYSGEVKKISNLSLEGVNSTIHAFAIGQPYKMPVKQS